MADDPQISILDARLAEIDRRLCTIQTGLADDVGTGTRTGTVPGAESGNGLPPRIAVPEPGARPEPEPEAPDDDTGQVIAALRGLVSDHARLLASMGEVLACGERLLARAEAPVPADRSQVTVVAGPFSDLEAVRDFERTLGTLPNVASVQARGYEGGDRTVVDVHLSGPNP